ncbi:hypothetical protein ACE939_08355 [Aquimarina sp. W85]|uniref:hypothetical protein n=1 Tax=Aquimarina rhodophyticola TaxID=3342246 RepID=UPI003672F4D0
MNELPLIEKAKLMLASSKEYRGVLIIGSFFILIGGILIFIGIQFKVIFLVVFGAIWASFSLFFMAYTVPSSISYYYEKALIKKYGKLSNACLVEKKIVDHSYFDTNEYSIDVSKKGQLISELNYLLTFSFEYHNKTFENSELVTKNQFEKLKIGDLIPIKFLSINPNKSSIRKIKLKKNV